MARRDKQEDMDLTQAVERRVKGGRGGTSEKGGFVYGPNTAKLHSAIADGDDSWKNDDGDAGRGDPHVRR